MVAIYVLLGVLADLYLFFLMYVASMAMIRAHHEKKLNGLLWLLCVPFVAIALIVDFINNLLVFSLIFWELPKELLVTSRLKRHAAQQTSRGKMARYIGEKLLNSFDYSGNHLD